MAEAQKNVLITLAARKKMCKARAQGGEFPKITKMAFGDGGCDEDGTVKTPTPEQTDLKSRIAELDKTIEKAEIQENGTTCRYTCKLGESDGAGKKISEIALVDSDNDVVAIKNFLPKGKDGDIEMTFYLDDIF